MLSVTCAIIVFGEKILVTQRSASMTLPLKWEFPGGKIQEGESEEECILRELKEELSIDVRIMKRLTCSEFHYDTFSITLIPFLVAYLGGEIQLSEHKEAKWLVKEELISLNWAAADIPILNELLQSGYV
jgi:8-oxo-dGTP diphosphatase